MSRFLFVGSLLGVLLLFGMRGAQSQEMVTTAKAPMRILCLGASITMGQGVNGGYRLPLEKMLEGAGMRVQFVGRQETNSKGMISPGHEGYPGYRVDQVEAVVNEAFKPTTNVAPLPNPDVVLILCGTNDVRQNFKLAEAPQRLDHLLGVIQGYVPGVRLMVASLPPDRHFDDAVRSYNAEVAKLVAKRAAAGQKVESVDVYHAINPGTEMSPDLTHPNQAGYDQIARSWFRALALTAPQVGFMVSKEGANLFTGKSCLGYQITMKRAATVRELGIFTDGQALAAPHAVGVFETTGKLLASTQVMPTDAPSGLFAYHALTTPLRLEAGGSYLFVSNSVGLPTLVGTQNTLVDPLYFDDSRFYFDHNIALPMEGTTDGNALPFPGTKIRDINGGVGYFGPIFRLAP